MYEKMQRIVERKNYLLNEEFNAQCETTEL
jgi:hypothetical protein